MCGINGIYAYHAGAEPIDRAELLRIRDRMAARGPDGKGEWVSDFGRIGFGHRRLSIIDLSVAGAQPMVSADGKLVITFNGEIYNYRKLREEIERTGRVFRSHSDTEVMLHLYAQKGEAMVHDLRGMFAFALWDANREKLFLARDPYGIKPLYYTDDGWTFRFSSQVKALLAGGKISRDPEPAGEVGFFLWGSVPEPFTTHRQIKALPAGCTMLVGPSGVLSSKRYHSIADVYCEAEVACCGARNDFDALEQIRASLLDSVSHHLVSDVPVGAFLSGGIDSGAIVGLMRDAGKGDILTVTLAFEEFLDGRNNEAPLADEVARTYGTRHMTRLVTEREFLADLPLIFESMDQPSIDGVNTWFVAKAASELGLKVAMSGLGGDELFGGYPSFRDIPSWISMMSWFGKVPRLGSMIRKAICNLGLDKVTGSPKVAGMMEYGGSYAGGYLLRRGLFMPWELELVLDTEIVRAGFARLNPIERIEAELTPTPKSCFAKIAVLESSLYMRNQLLRDTDWASMAHGLEVRVPLADARLLSRLSGLSMSLGGVDKQWLAKCPRLPLPKAVVERKKTGFSTPLDVWHQRLTAEFRRAAYRSLLDHRAHWSRRWASMVASQMMHGTRILSPSRDRALKCQ
jgi:asparagine synthase (glutamine-hydrolysing)